MFLFFPDCSFCSLTWLPYRFFSLLSQDPSGRHLDANKRIEGGYSLIVKVVIKACDERVKLWPQMLPYTLWADLTTQICDGI